jgi:hypothetical protein
MSLNDTLEAMGIHPLECALNLNGRFEPFPRPRLTPLPTTPENPEFFRPIVSKGIKDKTEILILYTTQRDQLCWEEEILPIRAYMQPDRTYEVQAKGYIPFSARNAQQAQDIMEMLITPEGTLRTPHRRHAII